MKTNYFFKPLIDFKFISLTFFLLMFMSYAFSQESTEADQIDFLSGVWVGNNDIIYKITKFNDTYNWWAPKIKQKGRVSIMKGNLIANWINLTGLIDANNSTEGQIINYDKTKKAIKIRWNNGVVFSRLGTFSTVNSKSGCEAPTEFTCWALLAQHEIGYFVCLNDPCSDECESIIENMFTFGIDCYSCLFDMCHRSSQPGQGYGITGEVICSPCKIYQFYPERKGLKFCAFYKGSRLISSWSEECYDFTPTYN